MRYIMQTGLLLFGGLMLVYSIFLAVRTNFNTGVILPGLLGLPLLLSGLFFHKLLPDNCRGLCYWIRLLLISGYTLGLLVFIVTLSLVAGQLTRKPDPRADALVVLGAALYGDRISATLALRLDTALHYWQQHPDLLIVVTGGQGPDEWIPEADAMAEYLKQKGVSPEKILIEARSTSTRENLSFAREHLLARLDKDAESYNLSVIVVTSAYHLYRAVQVAGQLQLNASGLGAPTLWYLLPADLLRETLAIARLHLLGY